MHTLVVNEPIRHEFPPLDAPGISQPQRITNMSSDNYRIPSLDDFDDFGRPLPPDRRPLNNRSDAGLASLPPSYLNSHEEEVPVDNSPMPILDLMSFDDAGRPVR